MTNDQDKKRPHRLEDHLLGMDPVHSHEDGEADHDHDHDDPGGEYDPTTSSLWLQDNITLLSVGIDIGSAGTQVIFSRVQLRRLSEELTSRYFVVNRETVYQSPVALTPYVNEARIDDQAIGRIIDSAYEAAGVHPDSVDTGAVTEPLRVIGRGEINGAMFSGGMSEYVYGREERSETPGIGRQTRLNRSISVGERK
jgi:ethanolamine utilization protein EutA